MGANDRSIRLGMALLGLTAICSTSGAHPTSDTVYGPKFNTMNIDFNQTLRGSRPFNPAQVETDGQVDVLFVYESRGGTTHDQQKRLNDMRQGALRAIGYFHQAVRDGIPNLQPALRLNLLGPVEVASVPNNIVSVEADPALRRLRETHRADVVIALHNKPMVGATETNGVVHKNYCRSPEGYWQHGYALVDEKQLLGTDGTAANPFVEIYTTAHELGHVFGAGHDLGNEQPRGCMYNDSSYGHSMIVQEHGRWSHYGTLMSYLGVRQPIFSNPNAPFRPPGYAGPAVPAGTRHANNARAVADSYRIISNYYPTPHTGQPLRANTGPTVMPQLSGPQRLGTVLHLTVTPSDAEGDAIGGAEVTWRRSTRLTCPKESNDTENRQTRPPRRAIDASTDYICSREGDTFTWSIFLTSRNPADYAVRGFDIYGTYGAAASGRIAIAR